MAKDLSGKYYVRKTSSGSWSDVTTRFDGLRFLKVDGFLSQGKPVNIYTAQWIDSQTEDYMVTASSVIRENADIEITFIVGQKYATNTIDVRAKHNEFITFMTGSDIWIKSAYVGDMVAHCVCLNEYKPTTVKLQRGNASYIIGTLTLHCLAKPS